MKDIHPYPLVSHGKLSGEFTSYRVSANQAWAYQQIQIGHAGSNQAALVLDCDNPSAVSKAMSLESVQLPNWIIYRADSLNPHLIWFLIDPVHRYPEARLDPLRYLAWISDYYLHALQADPGYSGILTHNPTYPSNTSRMLRKGGYTLDQLAEIIPFSWKIPTVCLSPIGRNVTLFKSLMGWAGKSCNRGLDCYTAALTINQEFTHPLPLSEVIATSRSVRKYRDGWEARGWHDPAWIARKRAGGRKSKRGPDPASERSMKPWEDQGISRPTYYRRKACEKLRPDNNTDRAAVRAVGVA